MGDVTRREALKLATTAGAVAVAGASAVAAASPQTATAAATRGCFRRDTQTKKTQFEKLDPLRSDQPALLKADFFSETGDDNKDHDTGVWVTVKTSDDKTLLAHVDNADSSESDATEYNDGSKHTIGLIVDSPGTPRDQCAKFKVFLKQTTHGNDTWRIKQARVTLHFSDGNTLVAEKTNFELKNDGASADFAAP